MLIKIRFLICFFFEGSELFERKDIDAKIYQSRPSRKKSENRPIVSVSKRSEVGGNDFGNHKSKERTDDPPKELPECVFDHEFMSGHSLPKS